MRLYTPRYRIWLWSVRYLRLRDLWQVLIVVPVIYLVTRLAAYDGMAASIGAVAYGVLAVLVLVDVLRGRKARDYAQAEVLHEFFAQLHGELFPGEKQLRITLFCEAPYASDLIMPWYRYTPDTENLIGEAQKSQAKYRKAEGLTGYAWGNAGEDIVIASFPAFASRRELEDYYVKTLNISPDTVSGISDYMIGIRTVLAHGFKSSNGEFLGVLSIDLPSRIEMDEVEIREDQRVGAIRINAGTMVQLLNSIENVLEAFTRVKEKSK